MLRLQSLLSLNPRFLMFPLLFGALATACSGGSSNEAPEPGSKVSNFTIDEFKAPEGGPAWESVQIIMDRSQPSPNKVDRSFTRSSFASGKAEEVEFKVEYGTYTVDLIYTDKDKKIVYRSCSSEKGKKHEINQPSFEANIKVCRVKSDGTLEPNGGGGVKIQPSADVKLTPTFSEEDETEGDPQTSVKEEDPKETPAPTKSTKPTPDTRENTGDEDDDCFCRLFRR